MRQTDPSGVLTPDDVLTAPAEFDHVTEVRSIGPAAVIVLEREAPLRAEYTASTPAEFDALREWISSSPFAYHVLDAYFSAKEAEEGIGHSDLWVREDAHSERLEAGTRISTLRVSP